MSKKREITAADIIGMEEYAAQRKDWRARLVAMKKNRRLQVGPNATFHFESFETMLYQVQEMIHTERGGEEQIPEELAAYNPLVPKGNELVCTLMLEMEDPVMRDRWLHTLGGIEETVCLKIGDDSVAADWEHDVDRTTPDGKTSAVHFLHFRLTDAQVQAFRDESRQAVLAVEHANYGHMAIISPAVRQELASDL